LDSKTNSRFYRTGEVAYRAAYDDGWADALLGRPMREPPDDRSRDVVEWELHGDYVLGHADGMKAVVSGEPVNCTVTVDRLDLRAGLATPEVDAGQLKAARDGVMLCLRGALAELLGVPEMTATDPSAEVLTRAFRAVTLLLGTGCYLKPGTLDELSEADERAIAEGRHLKVVLVPPGVAAGIDAANNPGTGDVNHLREARDWAKGLEQRIASVLLDRIVAADLK
jgi:hypothetical protein